jgi:hypothetical protein
MHRDPIDAIASVSSLLVILRSVFSDTVDPLQIGRDAVHYWMEAINRFMTERERLPSERVLDLHHSALQRDPIGSVRRIYNHFGWPFPSTLEQQMQSLLASPQINRNGSHRYDAAQFGLTDSEQFNPYRERFGLAPIKSSLRRDQAVRTQSPQVGSDESAFIA